MMDSSMPLQNANANELYAMLPLDVCQQLGGYEQSMTVPEGTRLIQHGVLPDGLVVLHSGAVKVCVPCLRRSASVTTAQEGRVFGMRATISGELPDIDVTCLESCRVTIVPRDAFLSVLKNHPEVYFAVARVLSADLQMATQILRTYHRRRAPASPVSISKPV
jgi:CRP-like cAMP-binding protein